MADKFAYGCTPHIHPCFLFCSRMKFWIKWTDSLACNGVDVDENKDVEDVIMKVLAFSTKSLQSNDVIAFQSSSHSSVDHDKLVKELLKENCGATARYPLLLKPPDGPGMQCYCAVKQCCVVQNKLLPFEDDLPC